MLKMTFFSQAPYLEYYGGGDCTYMEFPNGQNMLLDITTKSAGSTVIQQLMDRNVEQIDYFVASHLHRDHTGGFAELVEKIPVKQVILSGYGFQSVEADTVFLETVKNKKIPVQQVRMGDEMSVGDVHFKFLFPPKGIPEVSSELPYVEQEMNSNVYSLVFRLSYGKISALFTGDIYEKAEEQLVQQYGEALKSTLYKIPHHGNDTSSSEFAVETVKPQLAVTMGRSCEWNVQKSFSNAGIFVYGPFYDGTVEVRTDGVVVQVECGKGFRQFPLL